MKPNELQSSILPKITRITYRCSRNFNSQSMINIQLRIWIPIKPTTFCSSKSYSTVTILKDLSTKEIDVNSHRDNCTQNNKSIYLLSNNNLKDPWSIYENKSNLELVEILRPESLKIIFNKANSYKGREIRIEERILDSIILFYQTIQKFKNKLMFPGKNLTNTLLNNPGLYLELIKTLIKRNNILFAISIYSAFYEYDKFRDSEEYSKAYQLISKELINHDLIYDKDIIQNVSNIWKIIYSLNKEEYIKQKFLDAALNINTGNLHCLINNNENKDIKINISTQLSNKILSTFVNSEDYKYASQWITRMDELNISKDISTYNILLNYSIKCVDFKEFMKYLNGLLISGLTPDTITCNTLLNSLNKFSSSQLSSAIIKILDHCSFKPNAVTSSIVLSLRSKIEDITLKSFIDTKIIPKLNLSLMSVQIALFKIQVKQLEIDSIEFKRLLEDLVDPKVLLPRYKYTIMIYDLIRRKEYEKAEIGLISMINEHKSPTIQVMTCFAHNYLSQNMVEKAAEKLLQMVKYGLSPSKVMVQQVIIGMHKGGFVKQANEFLTSAMQLGFIPTRRIINSKLNQLIQDDDISRAVLLFKESLNTRFTPDTCTYNILLKGAINQKDFLLVRNLLNEMNTNKIPPNQITYMELLKGAYYGINHGLAISFYNKLKESSFLLDDRVKYHLDKHQKILVGSKTKR